MYPYEDVKKALAGSGYDVASDKKVANITGLSERRIRDMRLLGAVDEYEADELFLGARLHPSMLDGWLEDGMYAADIVDGLVDPNAI